MFVLSITSRSRVEREHYVSTEVLPFAKGLSLPSHSLLSHTLNLGDLDVVSCSQIIHCCFSSPAHLEVTHFVALEETATEIAIGIATERGNEVVTERATRPLGSTTAMGGAAGAMEGTTTIEGLKGATTAAGEDTIVTMIVTVATTRGTRGAMNGQRMMATTTSMGVEEDTRTIVRGAAALHETTMVAGEKGGKLLVQFLLKSHASLMRKSRFSVFLVVFCCKVSINFEQ